MKTKSILCTITVFATIAIPGFAQSLSSTYLRIESGVSVKGSYDGNNFHFVQSGLSQFDGFEAFCIEPDQAVSIGDFVEYDVSGAYLTPEIDESIAKLVGNFYSSGMTANEAAATQWAIWEVVVDGVGGSLLTGNSQVESMGIAGLGNSYLSQLPNLPATEVQFLSNPDRQDVVTQALVPEPSSLGLLALSSVLLLRRKR